MAVFPAEFFVGLICIFLLHRLSPYFSLSHFIVRKICYLLPPSEALLKSLDNPVKEKKKNPSASKLGVKTPEERLQNMYLHTKTIEHGTLFSTLYHEYFETLVLLTFAAVVTFVFSDLHHCFMPKQTSQEISFYGLSTVFFVAMVCRLQIQFGHGLTKTYEAKISLAIAFLSFVIALFAIFAPKQLLDVDMDEAVNQLIQRLNLVAQAYKLDPEIFNFQFHTFFYVAMAALAGIIVALDFLPIFRNAHVYTQLTKSDSTVVSTWQKLLLHINLILPILTSIAWIKPLTGDLLLDGNRIHCSENAIARDCSTKKGGESDFFLTESVWHQIRVWMVILVIVVRFMCMRMHCQFFLMEPKDSILNMLLQRNRVNGPAIRQKIQMQFSYFSVIAIQYIAPLCSLLMLVLAYKRKAQVDMHICHGISLSAVNCGSPYIPSYAPMTRSNATEPPTIPKEIISHLFSESAMDTSFLTKENIIGLFKGMNNFQFLSGYFYEQCLGFFIWWIVSSWSVLTIVGVAYWRNFPEHTVESSKKQPTPKLAKNASKKDKKSKKMK